MAVKFFATFSVRVQNQEEKSAKAGSSQQNLNDGDMGRRVADEPYIGQEFESEADAHAFYNAYATRVGFIVRTGNVSRSRRDGSLLSRALFCNKEGYRLPDKREKIIRQKKETRVGCKAMILVKKLPTGKWTINKCEKEHSHPLAPGEAKRKCIYEKYPTEHVRIQELTNELAAEKKRSETYKRHLEMVLDLIEEHNETMSKKIQHIADRVDEAENEEQ